MRWGFDKRLRTMTSTIPQTAKAAVASAPKEAYVIKADHPVKQPQELAPGECLVKLEYTGVCHTDAIMQQGYEGVADFPLVGGHEGIGRLVAIGENSPPSFIKIGDRVGVRAFGTVCMKYVRWIVFYHHF
jgi:propanol-preferring alcohol dehydrogenase